MSFPKTTEGKLRIAPRLHVTSSEPKIHSMQYADGEKHCTSKQESPHPKTEASKDVR
jgi:hypothetical protein